MTRINFSNLSQSRAAAAMNAARVLWFGVALTVASHPAMAQVTKVESNINWVQATLVAVSIITVTISFMWVGFKMIFQHAKWAEVAHIVIGAGFIGGASGLGAILAS